MEKMIVLSIVLFSAIPAFADPWYALWSDSARCVAAKPPVEMAQEFERKKISYHVFHYAERNGKPTIVKVIFNDGRQGGEILYFQDKSFCQEQAYLRAGWSPGEGRVTAKAP
ncbi:MAG TPA: hypothetical protein VF889_07015 [Bacteroidota bacterium]